MLNIKKKYIYIPKSEKFTIFFFCYLRRLVSNQRSPVHPVSKSRGVCLRVKEGQMDGQAKILVSNIGLADPFCCCLVWNLCNGPLNMCAYTILFPYMAIHLFVTLTVNFFTPRIYPIVCVSFCCCWISMLYSIWFQFFLKTINKTLKLAHIYFDC